MWPVDVDRSGPSFKEDSSFTLGGISVSLYEYGMVSVVVVETVLTMCRYLPKQYLILGGLLEQPRNLYEGFIDVARKNLFRRALNGQNTPLIISGDVSVLGTAFDVLRERHGGSHGAYF